jgi:hypothetical protein
MDFDNTFQLPFKEWVEYIIKNKSDYDKFPWDQEQLLPVHSCS